MYIDMGTYKEYACRRLYPEPIAEVYGSKACATYWALHGEWLSTGKFILKASGITVKNAVKAWNKYKKCCFRWKMKMYFNLWILDGNIFIRGKPPVKMCRLMFTRLNKFWSSTENNNYSNSIQNWWLNLVHALPANWSKAFADYAALDFIPNIFPIPVYTTCLQWIKFKSRHCSRFKWRQLVVGGVMWQKRIPGPQSGHAFWGTVTIKQSIVSPISAHVR